MTRALLASSCLVFAFACTPDSPGDESETGTESATTDSTETGDTDTTDTNTTDTNTTDTSTTDTTDPVEPVAEITGILLDPVGAPLPSPLLQFCGPIDDQGNVEACIPVPVEGSDGSFTINVLTLGLWSLKIVQGPVDDRHFAGQAFQLTVNDGDMLDYSNPPIVLPEVDVLTPLAGETPIDLGDGLTVMVDPANAISPDFVPPTELGGLAVPAEFWRVTDVGGSPVIAGWSFSPFGIKSTMTGFTFTLDNALGLDPGAAVVFHEIEKDNGSIHEIATGTVNGDATAIDVTPVGEGLHELTWLLVTQ